MKREFILSLDLLANKGTRTGVKIGSKKLGGDGARL